MGTFSNYNNYVKHKPEYDNWKQNADYKEAQRQEYIKQNPELLKDEDIQRGKSIIHAIDVMDRYSQDNAEDIEVATEMATSIGLEMASWVGMGVGALIMFSPAMQKQVKELSAKNKTLGMVAAVAPMALGYIGSIAASFPLMAWSAKQQVSASRKGRFEAMRNDLKDPKAFAILNDEQKEEVKEIAKTIKLSAKEKKTDNTSITSPIKTLKKIMKEDGVYKTQKTEFENQLNEDKKHFDDKISETDINNAKRDQQIMTKLVEKIDIASQDYTENVELATNVASMTALAGGGLVGWLASKVTDLMKIKNNSALKLLPLGIGAAVTIGISLLANKVQKQASRVGRFTIKQELMENPTAFTYIDEEKSAQMTDVKAPEKKKTNLFKFFIQAVKDNKTYDKYMKTEGLEDKKRHKAIAEIDISDEQIKEAKSLQQNVFKTFNKVDEKSQEYSESVEALGKSMAIPISIVSLFSGMGLGFLSAKNEMKQIAKGSTEAAARNAKSIISKTAIGTIAGILPAVGWQIYMTKEQKKASRVADMLAIKDLQDYKNFVDYSNTKKEASGTKEIPATNKIKTSETSSLFDKYKK
ncbi:MAG: hypothetical protein R3Y28_06275 [Candidatus Gastranaerophilales bacterium]